MESQKKVDFRSAAASQAPHYAALHGAGRAEGPGSADSIAEAAATLAAHPDPGVRLIAERLAEAKVRAALGAAGDQAERIAERDKLLRQLVAMITGQSTKR